MVIHEILEKLKNNQEYTFTGNLSAQEIQELQFQGYIVEQVLAPDCPCGHWVNDLCRCKWREVIEYLERKSTSYKITRKNV